MLSKRIVRTLIGHNQVEVGLRCLASLLRFTSESISLIIHDDGSLTGDDCKELIGRLPGAEIVSREEADAIVDPLVKSHPECRAYRERHPLALKLIDMALLPSEDLAYCDSDVLFLKPHTGLFTWPDEGTGGVFMQDVQDAYSLRPWHIYPLGEVRVPRRVNSGLILFRSSAYDLDFVEWLLSRKQLSEVFQKRPHWIEQTCWAALGWRAGCRVWSGRQIIIATPSMKDFSDDTVAIHFVAACRGRLSDFSAQSYGSSSPSDRATEIRSGPARISSPLRMFGQDLLNNLRLN
jgi:hypothetical protein